MSYSNLLLLLLSVLSVVKCNDHLSNYARSFNVGFLRQRSSTDSMKVILLTMSQTPVTFNISTAAGFNYTGATTIESPATINVPSELQVREVGYDHRNLGIYVTSDQPVSIVLVGYESTSPDSSYLALPCYEQPTQEYVYYVVLTDTFYSQVLLVGCSDNTTITITPSQNLLLPQDPQLLNSSLINVAAGLNHTMKLHSLQTLLITAETVALSGTRIVSNRPLTLVGGHDCTRVPESNDCDAVATQIPPTLNWGTEFLLMPLYYHAGQQFKLIPSNNDTEVNITCTKYNNSTILSEGEVFTFDTEVAEFCHVTCNRSCYITELSYNNSHEYSVSGTENGSALLMTVPPIFQYPNSVTFTSLSQTSESFYSLAVPADCYFNGTIIINNELTTLDWAPIYNTIGLVIGYGYNTTANGTYTISHSHPNGLIYVNSYGLDSNGSYGYLTGVSLNPSFMIRFNSSLYYANEKDDHVTIYVERLLNIGQSVSVLIQTLDFTSMATGT